MKLFTDNVGRAWSIAINVTVVKRLRDVLDVDIYGCVENGFESIAKLVSDPVRLADILFVICKSEADARNVTDEDFGRGLAGDAIFHAADAFVEELIDFFPDARARASLRKVIAKARTLTDMMLTRAEAKLEAIDLDSEATKWMNSFGNAPASSASTPARSRSAKSS